VQNCKKYSWLAPKLIQTMTDKKYSWLAPKFYWDEFETAYENSNGVAFLNCNLLTCSNLLIYSFGFVIAKMNTFA
jgi:hypothetical protein